MSFSVGWSDSFCHSFMGDGFKRVGSASGFSWPLHFAPKWSCVTLLGIVKQSGLKCLAHSLCASDFGRTVCSCSYLVCSFWQAMLRTVRGLWKGVEAVWRAFYMFFSATDSHAFVSFWHCERKTHAKLASIGLPVSAIHFRFRLPASDVTSGHF